MHIETERDLSKAVAYIDGEGNLRIRVPADDAWGMDQSVTLLADGGIDLTRSFYIEDARQIYFPGDSITFSL